jgi:succinate-semialdehyde dehydrogenase/glutarate-semialdehyde dehydrogenase
MAVVERVEAGSGSRRRLRLSNPATLAPLGEVEVSTAEDVSAVVERARKVQPDWAELSFDDRGRFMERAVRALIARQDEFVDTIVSETGKPAIEALGAEVLTACDVLQFYAKNTKRILADQTLHLHLVKTKKLRIVQRPLGVVGIITPWNFPFILALNPAVQALMAGNVVVSKPSEVTPFSGRLLEELFGDAGLPEGVFNLVTGDGETGAALVGSRVDKIAFTGSVATGRKVAEACGRRLVPCTLELGGKDPMIVCEDANLERAAPWRTNSQSGCCRRPPRFARAPSASSTWARSSGPSNSRSSRRTSRRPWRRARRCWPAGAAIRTATGSSTSRRCSPT